VIEWPALGSPFAWRDDLWEMAALDGVRALTAKGKGRSKDEGQEIPLLALLNV